MSPERSTRPTGCPTRARRKRRGTGPAPARSTAPPAPAPSASAPGGLAGQRHRRPVEGEISGQRAEMPRSEHSAGRCEGLSQRRRAALVRQRDLRCWSVLVDDSTSGGPVPFSRPATSTHCRRVLDKWQLHTTFRHCFTVRQDQQSPHQGGRPRRIGAYLAEDPPVHQVGEPVLDRLSAYSCECSTKYGDTCTSSEAVSQSRHPAGIAVAGR